MSKVFNDDKSWFEDFKDQFKSLDGQPFYKKIEHYFTYYWIQTTIVIIIIIMAVSAVMIFKRDRTPMLITGIFYTGSLGDGAQEKIKNHVADELNVDPDKYRVDVYSVAFDNENTEQMQGAAQLVTAMIIGGDLDFFVGLETDLQNMVHPQDEGSCDLKQLREFLGEEEFNRLEKEGRIKSQITEYAGEYPCMILTDNSWFAKEIKATGRNNYLGIITNAPHPEAAKALIKMIHN